MKLLRCELINKKFKFTRIKMNDDDIKFRFEYEGSFLFEYYLKFDDSVLVIKLNNGNMVCKKGNEYMVYSLDKRILCIVSL